VSRKIIKGNKITEFYHAAPEQEYEGERKENSSMGCDNYFDDTTQKL